MTAIRSVDSLKYGVRLFGYFLAVTAVGGILLGLGLELGYSEATDLAGTGGLDTISKTDLTAGGILAFLGSFVLLSGIFGILHKLVADSVAVGFADATPSKVTPKSEADSAVTGDDSAEATETVSEPETPTEKTPPQTEEPAPVSTAEEEQPSEPSAPPEATQADTEEQTAAAEQSLGEMFDESDEGERVAQAEKQPQQDGDVVMTPDLEPEPPEPPTEPAASPSEENAMQAPPAEGDSSPPEDDTAQQPREPTPEEIAFGTNTSDEEATDESESTSADEEESTAAETSTKSVGNKSGKDPLADLEDE
jgi:hypothetical protein